MQKLLGISELLGRGSDGWISPNRGRKTATHEENNLSHVEEDSISALVESNEICIFSKKGGTREWHLDKEILEKNARNKIRVHQCLPIVEKILEKPK